MLWIYGRMPHFAFAVAGFEIGRLSLLRLHHWRSYFCFCYLLEEAWDDSDCWTRMTISCHLQKKRMTFSWISFCVWTCPFRPSLAAFLLVLQMKIAACDAPASAAVVGHCEDHRLELETFCDDGWYYCSFHGVFCRCCAFWYDAKKRDRPSSFHHGEALLFELSASLEECMLYYYAIKKTTPPPKIRRISDVGATIIILVVV